MAAVEPVRHRPTRRTLTLLTVPIVALIVLSNVGDAMAPSLVDKHPLLLLAMNSRNRNLILATNQLSAIPYYLVATLRLLAPRPLFFLIGLWYGDAALVWMERKTKTLGTTMRRWEGWFGKAAYPIIFISPNQYVCLFAGAAAMNVPGFFLTTIAGTLVRLYLIRLLGSTFDAPIQHVLRFIGDHRTPLLVLSVALTLVFVLAELRSGGPKLEELDDLPPP